jgi:hypothetical protein
VGPRLTSSKRDGEHRCQCTAGTGCARTYHTCRAQEQ